VGGKYGAWMAQYWDVGWSGSSPDIFVVLVIKVSMELRKSCRERSYRSW
jgi:hypothetical protein